MKKLLLLALLTFSVQAQITNAVPANIRSAVVWDDTDSFRPDSTGFRVTIQGDGAPVTATTVTNRLDLLSVMNGQKNGVYSVTVVKLCSGGLESDPSIPLLFSWNNGIPAAPTRTRITTTVTIP